MQNIVISLFPGADLFGRGFEQAGYTVLRGPDLILGQHIETFHLPPHLAEGIIAGPPCQDFSRARRHPPTGHGIRMLTHLTRILTEAQPDWFLVENVPAVPTLSLAGYTVQRFNLMACEMGVNQRRNRSFQFGHKGTPLTIRRRTQSHFPKRAVLATEPNRKHRRSFAECCRLQGLNGPLTLAGISQSVRYRLIGNAVPLPVAQALADDIRTRHIRSHTRTCACGCGREISDRAITANAACRQRYHQQHKLTA